MQRHNIASLAGTPSRCCTYFRFSEMGQQAVVKSEKDSLTVRDNRTGKTFDIPYVRSCSYVRKVQVLAS